MPKRNQPSDGDRGLVGTELVEGVTPGGRESIAFPFRRSLCVCVCRSISRRRAVRPESTHAHTPSRRVLSALLFISICIRAASGEISISFSHLAVAFIPQSLLTATCLSMNIRFLFCFESNALASNTGIITRRRQVGAGIVRLEEPAKRQNCHFAPLPIWWPCRKLWVARRARPRSSSSFISGSRLA